MPKRNTSQNPRPTCWVVYDPKDQGYFKCTPNAKYSSWVRIPYAFTSEAHLVKSLERIRTTYPDAQVLAYSFSPELVMKVGDYGL